MFTYITQNGVISGDNYPNRQYPSFESALNRFSCNKDLFPPAAKSPNYVSMNFQLDVLETEKMMKEAVATGKNF